MWGVIVTGYNGGGTFIKTADTEEEADEFEQWTRTSNADVYMCEVKKASVVPKNPITGLGETRGK